MMGSHGSTVIIDGGKKKKVLLDFELYACVTMAQ
jgi:hypothetical protein